MTGTRETLREEKPLEIPIWVSNSLKPIRNSERKEPEPWHLSLLMSFVHVFLSYLALTPLALTPGKPHPGLTKHCSILFPVNRISRFYSHRELME